MAGSPVVTSLRCMAFDGATANRRLMGEQRKSMNFNTGAMVRATRRWPFLSSHLGTSPQQRHINRLPTRITDTHPTADRKASGQSNATPYNPTVPMANVTSDWTAASEKRVCCGRSDNKWRKRSAGFFSSRTSLSSSKVSAKSARPPAAIAQARIRRIQRMTQQRMASGTVHPGAAICSERGGK